MQLGDFFTAFELVEAFLIIAWRILHVVTLGRECPDLPCDVVFATEEWQAAWIIDKRSPPPAEPPKLGETRTEPVEAWYV